MNGGSCCLEVVGDGMVMVRWWMECDGGVVVWCASWR